MADISVSGLIAGFIFSVWAFYFLKRAKALSSPQLAFVGVVLLVMVYVVPDPLLIWPIGILLTALGFKLNH